MSWVPIRRPRQQVSKGGSVEEYVNYMSMPENGLDCQSRRSKSFILNGGTLSTEVLRVAIGSEVQEVNCSSLFGLEVKDAEDNGADGRIQGLRRTNNRAHFSQ